MRNHLADVVNDALSMVTDASCVLDIGCNDGTLLENYPADTEIWGVDPSNIAAGLPQRVNLVQDIFPSKRLTATIGSRKFDVITSIAMFYDLEDPITFANSIRECLAENGLWIFEMSYMPEMLATTSYDTICHEHLEYYSLAVIEWILERSGLRLVRVQQNAINGGSIRCFATHRDFFGFESDKHIATLNSMRQSEFDLGLESDKPYKEFEDRVNLHRKELYLMVRDLVRLGKSIHLYGASTKGNTLLQACGIDSRLVGYAADRNPDKHGAMTLGTDIHIISEAQSRSMKPDYYLVLPWHFRAEFIEREREIIANGTKFIFPLPKIEIIGL